ncbi:hypothetical protein PFISCL1PPCAC_770, partial [Pristionchus fissidentatus]
IDCSMAKHEEEAWSSGGGGGQSSYYPSQTQYTYAYSNPSDPPLNEQAPQAGGIGMHNDMYADTPSAPPPPHMYQDHSPPTAAPPEDPEAQKPQSLAFSERSIRAAFIRKVFGLVTLMLLVVVAECSVAVFVDSVNDWLKTNSGLIAMGCSCAVFFILYFIIICVPPARKSFPINIILAFLIVRNLQIFAGSLGFLVAQLCAYFTLDSIILCVGLLVASVASIALFSCQTRFDMMNCAGMAILLSMYLFWIAIFSCGYMFWWYNPYWLNIVWSVLACTLFMLYLAIDIQLIMGGRRHSISPEEYVIAAVQIFIDVVYIFMFLLQIFGVLKK